MNIITDNLFDTVLIEPIKHGADELFIVSGYATATMAMRHIEFARRELKKDIAIRIIVGMCSQDGIQKSQHLGFQKLQSGDYQNDFRCDYIVNRPPVHSKVYSWFRKGEPFLGYLGSANYTQNAFSSSMREVLSSKSSSDCFAYYKGLIGQTISCLSEEVPGIIDIFDKKLSENISKIGEVEQQGLLQESGLSIGEKVTLSLIKSKTGEVHDRSGLNWGQRPEARRDPNQAYIPVPANIGRSGFFPERYEQFMVLTDDGKELICVRAQDNGKAIHTTLRNSFMGEYFRYRLGLPSGSFITKNDLLRYGRTDVDFYKVDDETFMMDFSVQ